ncbi:hypothetical protein [Eubacterium ramulus]|uniref:hypothetical protein n=1 Tax=Eubacterium ramulus TaxID=39490 RepID=UPI00399ADF5E
MTWDNKDKTLHIEDGYFSGITILGYDEQGNKVMPGMAGSNVRLKDFSQSNNSVVNGLSETEQSKLIETLEALNKTLSSLNIDTNTHEDFEKGGSTEKNMKFEELLSKYNKAVEDITLSMILLRMKNLKQNSRKNLEQMNWKQIQKILKEVLSQREILKNQKNQKIRKLIQSRKTELKVFLKYSPLSHEDLRSSLYRLLEPIEMAEMIAIGL